MGPERSDVEAGSPAGDTKPESLTMDRPSAGAATVGPSLTPPSRQTTLVAPVRPFPARLAGRPRHAVSSVPAEQPVARHVLPEVRWARQTLRHGRRIRGVVSGTPAEPERGSGAR